MHTVGMPPKPSVGTAIKRARERRRWTQRQLAAELGVDIKSVDNWENGRTRPRSSIGAIEEVLGISLNGGPAPEEPESEWERWERYVMNLPHLPPDVAAAIVTDARRARDEHLAAGRAAPSAPSPSPAPDRAAGRHRAAG